MWSDPLGAIVGTPRRRAAAAAVLTGVLLIGAGLLLMGPADDGPQVLGALEERTTTTTTALTTTTTTASGTTTTTLAEAPDTPDPAVPPPGTAPPGGAPPGPAPSPAPPPAPDPGPAPGPGGGATDPRPCGEGHPVDESEAPQPGCYWKASDNALVVEVAQGEFADWTSSSTVGPRWLAFDLGVQGDPVPRDGGHEVTVTISLTNVLDRPMLFDGRVAVQLVVQHQGAVSHVLDVVLADVDRLLPGETRRGTATFVVTGEGRHDIHGETVFALD